MNVISIPLTAAVMVPDRPAVIDSNGEHTYAELMERVSFLAGGLKKHGFESGWRCGFIGPSSCRFVECYLAVSGLNGVFVPLDPNLSSQQLSRRINALKLDALFLSRTAAQNIDLLCAREQLSSVKLFVALDFQRKNYLPYGQLLAEKEFFRFVDCSTGDDPNVILYSAGRTGEPRGITVSHNGFLHTMDINFSFQVQGRRFDDEPVSLLSIPLYHMSGFLGVLGTLYKANTMVMKEWDGPAGWYRTVAENQVNICVLTPRMLAELTELDDENRIPLPTLRSIRFGWDVVSESIMRRTAEIFPGVKVSQSYGTTDIVDANLMVLTQEECLNDGDAPLRVNSCGKADPDRIHVVDPSGQVVSGKVGEIMVRPSPGVLGYYREDGEFVPASQHWIHTNDLGYLDSDGYLYLIGYKIAEQYLRGYGIDGTVEISPSIFSKRGVENDVKGENISQEKLRLYFSFFCKMSECRSLEELRSCYLSSIARLISADLYGISLTGENTMTEIISQTRKGNYSLQWTTPNLKKLSFYTRETDSNQLEQQDMVLREEQFSAQAMMSILRDRKVSNVLCVPLYSDTLRPVGMLFFANKDENNRFDNQGRMLIHLLAGNMGAAQMGILRNLRLQQQIAQEESALSVLGYGVILSNHEGEVLYMNGIAREILFAGTRSCASRILETILDHLNTFRREDVRYIKSSVNYFFREGDRPNARMLIVKTRGSRESREIVTTLDWLDRRPEYSHFMASMSGRRAEFVNLFMEGMPKNRIAQTMSISINTVNYHLKQLLAHFQCSTQVELLARLYSIFYASE